MVARDYRDYHSDEELTFAVSNEETFMDELEMLKLADSPADVNVAFYASPKERSVKLYPLWAKYRGFLSYISIV